MDIIFSLFSNFKWNSVENSIGRILGKF